MENKRLKMAQLYYKYVEELVNSFKQTNKKMKGHNLYKFVMPYSTPNTLRLVGVSMLPLAFIPFLMMFNVNPFISFPLVAITAAAPMITSMILSFSNSELAMNMQKIQINDKLGVLFNVYFASQFADVMNAKDASELAPGRLDEFAMNTIFLANGFMNEILAIKDRVSDKVLADYAKIKKLHASINKKNKDEIEAKINNIIFDNEQYIKPLAKMFNEYSTFAKILFESAEAMTGRGKELNDSMFKIDTDYLRCKYETELRTFGNTTIDSEIEDFLKFEDEPLNLNNTQSFETFENIDNEDNENTK